PPVRGPGAIRSATPVVLMSVRCGPCPCLRTFEPSSSRRSRHRRPERGPVNDETQHESAAEPAAFSTDTSNLEDCLAPMLVELADGDTFDLRIAPVIKQLGDDRVRM